MVLHRPLVFALGCTLAFAGVLLGLTAAFAPGVELNPFQASPESGTVNLVTAVVLAFVGTLVVARTLRASSATA